MKRKSKKQAAADASPKNKKVANSVYLNLLTDFGFKKAFGEKEVVIPFLNDVIMPENKITDVIYCPTEQLGDWESERSAVYDLLCTNEKGEAFLVEMQRAKQEFFVDRLLFYASFLIRKQAIKGKWNFQLKAVYVVSILNFVLNEDNKDNQQVVNRVCLMEETTHAKFSDKLRFVYIELPKFTKQAHELESDMDTWLFCLKNSPDLQGIPPEITGEVFRRLFEIIEREKLTPKEMETYNQSVLEHYAIMNALSFERKQSEKRGIEIGEERGRKKGKIEAYANIIPSLTAMGMSIEEIAKLTNLTAKEVQTMLQNKNN